MSDRAAPDWKAAANAAEARRAELDLTQEELIERMGKAGITVQAYSKFINTSRSTYRRTTLAAISQALGWTAGHLWDIAHRAEVSSDEVAELRDELATLAETVDRIESALREAGLPMPEDDPPSG